jgi:hypothetical protein
MMLPTHALAGMLLALPVLFVAPEYAVPALLGGFLGGVLPDVDLYVGHRRTLHFPVYYSLLALPSAGVLLAFPSQQTAFVALLLTAAAAHSVADAFGGGLELRPWEGTSTRAVYDHYHDRWIEPRRWVRYDGAPEDLALTGLLAVPLWMHVPDPLGWLVAGTASVALVYSVVRRVLPTVVDALVSTLSPHAPPSVLARIPDRYLSSGP